MERSGQCWVRVWAWTLQSAPSQTLSFRRAWELLDEKVIGYVEEPSGGIASPGFISSICHVA